MGGLNARSMGPLHAVTGVSGELGPMRNQRGTGHGRAVPPDVAVEHGLIACDAACLWCRWALRRLGPYILGDVSALVNDCSRVSRSTGAT